MYYINCVLANLKGKNSESIPRVERSALVGT